MAHEMRVVEAAEDASARCSFCGKTADQVELVIESVAARICDECVATCSEIVAEHGRAQRG